MLQSNPALTLFAVLFSIGAALFAIGGRLARTSSHEPEQWTRSLTDASDVTPELRIEMIERLAMVGLPWCVQTLCAAIEEERDATVRDAAERALIVVYARS